MAEVGDESGAGTGCGGCRPEIASILDSERQVTSIDLVQLRVLRSTG